MNIAGFNKFCEGKEYKKEIIEEAVKIVEDFNNFLQSEQGNIDTATEKDIHRYAQHLIETGNNRKETFFALIRYCYFSGNENMLIALYELLDGSDVLDNLARELSEVVGEEKSKKILQGISFPVLGTTAMKKPVITKKVIQRLEENLDENTCYKILVSNLHGIPKESYNRQREKFLEAKNIDEYLTERHTNFIKILEKHRDEQTLFYTQEVDAEVVEHVKNNPQIEGGIRKGKILYTEKIPYLTKKFLNETDENMKKYFYCHCTWVREALRTGEIDVPSKFCKCSAGYYKNQWDVILDQPVNVEVLETILDGDSRCLFAIHLPEEVVKQADKK